MKSYDCRTENYKNFLRNVSIQNITAWDSCNVINQE